VNKASNGRYNTFEDFWPDFIVAMNVAREKKTPGPVSRLLTRQAGFVPSEDQVKRVYQQITELPNSDALEFSFFVRARAKRPASRIVTGLADLLWIKYRNIAGFPDIEHPTWVDIQEWIPTRVSRAISDKHDLMPVGRAIFASLLRYRDRDFYTGALLLFADQLAGATRKQSEPRQNEIETLLAELLVKPKLNRKQAAAIRLSGRAMQDEMQAAIDQRRQAVVRTEFLEREIENQKSVLQSKDQQLRDHAAAVESLKEGLAAANKELSATQGRVTGTEEHWAVVLKQKLSGLVAKLKSDIQHETQEIVLCLDRSSPNIAMALERARQIDKILEQAEKR
jgi:hypothetical protein